MADLLINGKDALIEWGVRMGDGFLDAINGYYPLKDYINLTLTFTMEGASTSDFTTKNHKFIEELRKGDVLILIPKDSPNVYHLKYTGRNCTFARNTDRTFAKIGLSFIEPNPTNRT